MKTLHLILGSLLFVLIFTQCDDDDDVMPVHDPDTAMKASIDRFGDDAGTLFVRDASNGLPEANAAIDFDEAPFITQGLGPDGEIIQYYNFDAMPVTSAPIFVLFREGESEPVNGQLNIIDAIPGDVGYNDFWHVHKVTVPDDYVANTTASRAEIAAQGYTIERTNMLVNCPVVPEGSTADLRYGAGESTDLVRGWYKEQVVFYFTFAEKELTVTLPSEGSPAVPLSDIYVSFNINPGETGGGPPSGFMTESGSVQTHNVTETIPEEAGYSPYWLVNIYDNAEFDAVGDLTSATSATILAPGAANVNCPVVSIE
jgi:hypothetical protein